MKKEVELLQILNILMRKINKAGNCPSSNGAFQKKLLKCIKKGHYLNEK